MASITKLCSALLQSRSAILASAGTRQTRAMCTALKADESIKMKHKPSNFDRKVLVWTKKFKTVEEVPDVVNVETMERARNRLQIKSSNWLMILSGVVCLYIVNDFSGKNGRNRSESINNLKRQKEYNQAKEQSESDYFDKLAAAGIAEQNKALQMVTK